MDETLFWLLMQNKPVHTTFLQIITKNLGEFVKLDTILKWFMFIKLRDILKLNSRLDYASNPILYEWLTDLSEIKKEDQVGWEDHRYDIEIILNGDHLLRGDFTLRGGIDNPFDYFLEESYPHHLWELRDFTYTQYDLINTGEGEYLDGQLNNKAHKSYGGLYNQRIVRDGLINIRINDELYNTMSIFYSRKVSFKFKYELWEVFKGASLKDGEFIIESNYAYATKSGNPTDEKVGYYIEEGQLNGGFLLNGFGNKGIPARNNAEWIGVWDGIIGIKIVDNDKVTSYLSSHKV